MRALCVSLTLFSLTACFDDRTLNKACTERFPCVVDGDRCVDGVCRRGLPAVLPLDDAGFDDDDAGTSEDAGALDDAGTFIDAGANDAGALADAGDDAGAIIDAGALIDAGARRD